MKPRLAALVLAGAGACAHIAPPPGGPEDRAPPILIGIRPDSVQSLPGFDEEVEFTFDEIISEGAQPNFGLGTGDLEQLVVLSPSPNVPVVRWRRSRITVRPREGWQPNTVYRVELLAGVNDLRRNAWRGSVVTTFSTGEALPTDSLRGRVIDWTTRRPVPNAVVEAILQPDSLAYRTLADSSGRFALAPLPAGEYLVYGGVDQNRNRRIDPREAYDSVRVAAGRDSVGELWAFRHDSTPPRIQNLSSEDTLTILVTFNQPLDPFQRLPVDSVRVRLLPDSTPVPVLAALPKEAFDSQYARRPPRDTSAADTSAAAVRDTTPAPGLPPPPPPPAAPAVRQVPGARVQTPARDTLDRGPLTSRPPLSDRLLLRMEQNLAVGARYLVELLGVRNVGGAAGDVRAVLAQPTARPDSAAADTTARPAPPPPPPPAPSR